MENIQLINKNLRLFFGEELNGKPRFRLVWSNSLIEKRFGTFDKFYKDTDIWLGQWTGVEERPKYSWLKEKWVLERYCLEQKNFSDIRDGDCYEPAYVFQDKDGNYLKPIWRVVEIICTSIINAISGNLPKRTQKMDDYDYEKKLDKEVQVFMDALDINPATELMFKSGEAVLLPGKSWE